VDGFPTRGQCICFAGNRFVVLVDSRHALVPKEFIGLVV
jgi:hypothetical protein